MKKTLVFGFALAFSITPLSAFAAVNSISGLTAADQSLVSPNSGATNTMHMDIITLGTDTHRFKWDGTPWRVDQGGTGWTNFTPGALIYGNGASGLATTAPATAGQILQFNGTFPTWVPTSTLGIVAHPAGSNGEVQYNDNGVFGGSGLLMDSGSLIVPGLIFGSTIKVEGDPIGAYLDLGTGWLYPASHILGGTVDLRGGDINLSDEANFPDGLYPGDAEIEGGTISSSNGYAEGAQLITAAAQWESGTGWKGGDINIIPGRASQGTHGRIVLFGREPVNESARAVLGLDNLTAERTFAFPDSTGTFGLLEATQAWTGANTFSQGAVGTTTVNFGTMGSSTSHVCFNTKNSDGQDISFYFVGTSMVVESNTCQ